MPGGVVAGAGSTDRDGCSAGGESPSDDGSAERLGAELSIATPRLAVPFLAFCPLTPGLERGVPILDQLFVER